MASTIGKFWKHLIIIGVVILAIVSFAMIIDSVAFSCIVMFGSECMSAPGMQGYVVAIFVGIALIASGIANRKA